MGTEAVVSNSIINNKNNYFKFSNPTTTTNEIEMTRETNFS